MKTIVFDVSETLLDLRAMQPRVAAALGGTELLATWFGQLLRHSLVATVTDAYQPFDVLGQDALRLVASKAGIDVSEEQAAHVVEWMGIRQVPPHDWDVTGAIRAGAAAAFVARPGMLLSEASETPGIIGPDLEIVAAAIIDIDG